MMKKGLFGLLSVGLAFGLWACGGSSTTTTSDEPTDGDTERAQEADSADTDGATEIVGAFDVVVTAPVLASDGSTETAGKTSFTGTVNDGPTPSATLYDAAATDGACTLYKPRVPFCETSCGSAVCVKDDVCQAYPNPLDVGTLTVTGMKTAAGADSFELKAVNKTYQTAGTTKLAYPAFSEGDTLQVAAAGAGNVPAFTLTAKGIAALELTNTSYALTSGHAFTLTWTPAGTNGNSTVFVKLDISHHGGTKGMILCSGADNGSLTISASLMTSLLNLGVAGFPSVIVTRQTSGTADIPVGRVELNIQSPAEHSVTVDGLNSCNEDSDCPTGKTCQTNLTCQ